MAVIKSKFSRPYIFLFILVNLVTSNFLVNLLPPNLIQFVLAMWSPAIFALLFAVFLDAP